MLKKLKPQSEFMRNVMTIMTGTAISQVIPLVIVPFLTRIYSPEEFGIFALFMAIAAPLSVLVTGRFELAIIIPKKDEDAVNIAALTLLIVLGVSAIIFLIIFLLNYSMLFVLSNYRVTKWLPLVPIMVFLTGIYSVFNFWSNRRKRFRRLAVNRVCQTITTGTVSLIMGLAGLGVVGLIAGAMIGQGVAAGLLGIQIWLEDHKKASFVKKEKIKEQAREHSNFPKYSIVADMINNVTNQLPVILFTAFFGASISGLFSLTERVLTKPISLLSDSFREVFKQRASSDYAREGTCKRIFVKTAKKLSLISLVVFSILFLIAPTLFAFVFGEEWRVSGEYVRILAFMYAIRFTVSPLSYVLYIAQKQKYDLAWQMALFLLVVASLYAGYLLGSEVYSLVLFSTFYSLMYIIYAFMSYRFAKGNSYQILEAQAL